MVAALRPVTLNEVFAAWLMVVTRVEADGVNPDAVDLWSSYLEKQFPEYWVQETLTEFAVIEDVLAVTAAGVEHTGAFCSVVKLLVADSWQPAALQLLTL